MENYIIIDGFENYSVSDLGNVRNNKTGRILKWSVNDGYFFVGLRKHKIKYNQKIHRLVVQAFIPNLENKNCVDHIDNDRKQ